MVLDPWMRNPTFQEIFDSFDDYQISTYKWSTSVIVGATSITETGGFLKFVNVGGAAGISYLPSRYAEFGKHSRVSVDIRLVTGSVIGDGNHAEASLVLYKNANNWIRYGPYRDVASGINNRAYLRIMQNGVLTVTAVDITVCDTDIRHTFTIAQSGIDVFFYLNGVRATAFEWPEFIGLQVWLEAGTAGAGQKIEAHFDNFEVQDSYDPMFVTIGGLIRYIYEQFPSGVAASVWDELKSAHTTPNTFGDYLDTKLSTLSVNVAAAWDALKTDHVIPGSFGDYLDKKVSTITGGGDTFTAVSGTLSLPSTTAVALEFLAATYGTVFRPIVSFNVVSPTLDYCYMYSNATFTDYTLPANNLSSGDVPLVAASNAAINDVIVFGRTALSHRLNCVISNGPFNTDNVFAWKYWDGAAWQALANVVDGTYGSTRTFSQDGSVTWSTDVTTQTLNGKSARWVAARISTLGASRPIGSYFSLAADSDTSFDAHAPFGTYLYMEVYRKVGGAYPLRPDDIMILQQANLRKNPSVDILCYSDTKIVFTLSATPSSSISVPYQGTVETLKT